MLVPRADTCCKQRVSLEVEHLRAIRLRHAHVADVRAESHVPQTTVCGTPLARGFSMLNHVQKAIFLFMSRKGSYSMRYIRASKGLGCNSRLKQRNRGLLFNTKISPLH